MARPEPLESLLGRVRACRLCEGDLGHPARPVLQFAAEARILIAGQAPGRRVHESGIPFDDPSGIRLRDWLGVDEERFRDPARFAILPLGFCFPGSGSGGDLAPRPECAATWRHALLARLEHVELTLVLGRHALGWHLPGIGSLTEGVRDWERGLARGVLVLPHPSPRNRAWFARHPWFEAETVPALRARVAAVL
ncbi:MAG: uracil-DNA glycosylase family protein [Planctomycetota bacterium]